RNVLQIDASYLTNNEVDEEDDWAVGLSTTLPIARGRAIAEPYLEIGKHRAITFNVKLTRIGQP
ncbi:MAG TPA: hypothetical protein VEY93_09450, partial [Longimicrobium sp.]|nr:hypothetical protein [Longimicrobium sp.]